MTPRELYQKHKGKISKSEDILGNVFIGKIIGYTSDYDFHTCPLISKMFPNNYETGWHYISDDDVLFDNGVNANGYLYVSVSQIQFKYGH